MFGEKPYGLPFNLACLAGAGAGRRGFAPRTQGTVRQAPSAGAAGARGGDGQALPREWRQRRTGACLAGAAQRQAPRAWRLLPSTLLWNLFGNMYSIFTRDPYRRLPL